MAVALGVALGAAVVLPAWSGHAQWGSAVGLGFVLTAVPTLPLSLRPSIITIAARAAAVLAGAAAVVVTAGHPVALAVATVAAAVAGALIGVVGPTAALAVVLIALDTGAEMAWTQIPVYGLGAAAVPVAWAVWASARRLSRRPVAARPEASPVAGRPAHAVRVGVAVAVAVCAAFAVEQVLPDGVVGAHWLVTCVVLTVQPVSTQTGVRLAQRLSGNTVGAVIAAVLLGAHLPGVVVVGATVALFVTAMALRPVNYTWWAVTGPPVLLVISEYPHRFPWYEGGVRLGMNLAGAAVVVTVVFVAPAVWNRVRAPSGA